MAGLIRSFDWSQTPVGPLDRWPVSLRTVVDTLVASRFPMALLWGPELLLIYNDAYRAICADKHPAALGRSTREIWSEVWPINEPIFAAVMERGETLYFEDKVFPINRRGYSEDACFTLCYSPVRVEDGSVGGTLVVLQETTARKRAETALLESGARYRAVVEDQTEVISRFRADGIFLFVNDVYCRFFGKPAGELLNRKWQPVAHAEDVPRIEAALRTLSPGCPVVVIENRVFSGAGELRWMQFVNRGFFDAQGRLQEVQSVGRDITERKQLEEALQETNQKLNALIEASPLAVIVLDATGNVALWNPASERMFGWTRAEVAGRPLPTVQPDMGDEFAALRERVLRGETVPATETRRRRKDGTMVEVSAAFAPLRDAKGDVIGTMSILADITARKRAQDALRESEIRFASGFEFAAIGMALVGLDGRWLKVNRAFCELTGHAANDLLTKTFHDITHPEDLETDLEFVRQMLAGKRQTYQMEKRYLHKQGHVVWVLLSVSLVRDGQGQPLYFISQIQDITGRRQAEAALRQSEARYRSLVASSLDAVLLTEPDGGILAANEAACRMFGRTEAELIGLGRAGVADASDPRLAPALEARARTGRFYGELTFVRADGSKFPVEVSSVIFHSATGEPCTSMVIRDITERKRLESERAAMLTRLAAVEEQERRHLSRELHDQTAQRIVALAVELKTLERNLAAGRPQGERVGALRKAVDDLQRQIREIAWDLRAGELVEGELETALREFAEEWSERTRVSVDCECRGVSGERLPPQVATPLYRIVKEALTNVEKHAQARHVSVLLERDASLMRLTVEDDGRGFDVDAIQTSPGTAQHLGLLGMKERAALAGGTFLIESSPGSGTTILVRMPMNADPKSS